MAVYLTRIKNNQITDATITGTKLVNQTLTSNLFAANLTLASNITVLGNFQVTGTPTTINSINTYINDPLVVFNNGYSGSLSGYDIGVLFNRNLSTLNPYGSVNTALIWAENSSEFQFIATTDTGSGVTSINNSGWANLQAGNTLLVSSTISSNLIVNGTTTLNGFISHTADTQMTTANIGGFQAVAIGNVTPGSAAFTTVQASGLITANGNLTITNGTPSLDKGSGALTVVGGVGIGGNLNAFGKNSFITALQNTVIGNITPAAATVTTMYSTDTTQATSTTTGAVQIAGGASIQKDLWVGGNVYAGNILATQSQILTVEEPLIYLTTNSVYPYNYDVGFYSHFIGGPANVYAHTGFVRNYVDGDWYLFSNIGEPSGNVVNLGSSNIVYDGLKLGSVFVQNSTVATSTVTGAVQVAGGIGIGGNIYGGAAAVTSNGLLTTGSFGGTYSDGIIVDYTTGSGRISVGANDSLIFYSGGLSNSQTLSIDAYGVTKVTGNLVATSGTNSTSTTTGALVVTNNGGLGVMGNVYFGNAAVFNASQTANQDVLIRGKNDSTLLWARPNSTYDQVLVGGSAPAGNLIPGAKFQINSSDSMLLPIGYNAQRPGSSGFTDVAGMFRFNLTYGAPEWYDGTSWTHPTTNFTVIQEQQFNGDGSTSTFTIANPATTGGTLVSVNGVLQIGGPSYSYTVSGTTLTFNEPPSSGDVIDVRILTTTQTITSLTSSLGYVTVSVNDFTGITFISNPVNTTLTPAFTMPLGGGLVTGDANVAVASAGAATTIDTFSTSTYRSAKYIVQVTHGTSYQTSEVLVVQNGSTPYVSEYGVVQTNGNLGITSATISSGNVLVQFTGVNSSNSVRLTRQYVPI